MNCQARCDTEKHGNAVGMSTLICVPGVAYEVVPSHAGLNRFVYKHVPVYDMEAEDLVNTFEGSFAFIDEALKAGALAHVPCHYLVDCLADSSCSDTLRVLGACIRQKKWTCTWAPNRAWNVTMIAGCDILCHCLVDAPLSCFPVYFEFHTHKCMYAKHWHQKALRNEVHACRQVLSCSLAGSSRSSIISSVLHVPCRSQSAVPLLGRQLAFRHHSPCVHDVAQADGPWQSHGSAQGPQALCEPQCWLQAAGGR
eukprot:scaffold50747_cov17-Tisochrysis_lutea.AAC.3